MFLGRNKNQKPGKSGTKMSRRLSEVLQQQAAIPPQPVRTLKDMSPEEQAAMKALYERK